MGHVHHRRDPLNREWLPVRQAQARGEDIMLVNGKWTADWQPVQATDALQQ